MDELVHNLARARKAEAELSQKITEVEATLALTELGQWLASMREILKAARAKTADAEIWVRNAALAIHEATDNKQPHRAVKVILSTTLDYNPIAALDYARQHLPQALKLDKRTFEKAAKVLGLDFVTIGQEPQTRIDRDLSDYLKPTLQDMQARNDVSELGESRADFIMALFFLVVALLLLHSCSFYSLLMR